MHLKQLIARELDQLDSKPGSTKSKLTIAEVLLFTYHWWYATPMKFIQQEYGMSNSTCVKWSAFCREIAIDQVIDNSQQIGGPGVIVEIDESKFGKSTQFI